MNRRGLAATVVIAGALATVTWWRLRPRPPKIGAAVGLSAVEPGPLFVGDVPPVPASRSRGCGAGGGKAVGRAFSVEARKFFVWGPADDGHEKPIVLAFHGWGSNGRQFEEWFTMEKHVDQDTYVVYPDAQGDNWDYEGSRDIDFVTAMLDVMASTYCVDRRHVLALGFSYGGRFVNHLGCRAPSLVRGIVVAGSRWDSSETTCASPIPVLVVHRTHDETMPIRGGRDAAARWAKLLGCTANRPIANGCIGYTGCQAGAVTFCEDLHFDPEWPESWNHTMREPYQDLAWQWFQQLR